MEGTNLQDSAGNGNPVPVGEEEILRKKLIDCSHFVEAIAGCTRDYFTSRDLRGLETNYTVVQNITKVMTDFNSDMEELLEQLLLPYPE